MSLKLGNKTVGPVALGLMGFTAKSPPIPFDDAVKTMKAALDMGSNIFNGGDFYGPPNANSLQLLNYYFTKYPEDKDKVYLSMKGCFSFHPVIGSDNSPENVRKSIDTCLKELDDKAFIDSFETGRQDPKFPIETTVELISEYVKAGKIGGISLSECSASTIRRAHAVFPITSVEVELSMFSTDPLNNGIAAACAELGISLLAYAPLSRGFLTGHIKKYEDLEDGDTRKFYPRFQPDVFNENLKLVNEVEKMAKQKGCTPAQVAIGWVRSLSKKTGMPQIIPLPGATTVARVEENSKLIELDEKEMKAIDDILMRIPVQGHRVPVILQPFVDE